ncbi:hypothetical protein [Kribbella swartbergensis]
MNLVQRWASAVGVFALLVAGLGVVVLLDVRHQKAVAQDFLSTGVPTMASTVQLHVDTGRGGDYIDEVHVVFSVATDIHIATLTNSLGDPEGNEVGRHPPAAGTRYAPPLAILYKSDDPDQVIALADAEYFAADSATSTVAAGMISVGGTIVLAAGASVLLTARLRRRGFGRHASVDRGD